MSEWNSLTIHNIIGLLEKGECTSRDIVQELISVIRSRDKEVNAYLNVDEEYALRQADDADKKREQGQSGKLLGVPIAVKDVLNVIREAAEVRFSAGGNLIYVTRGRTQEKFPDISPVSIEERGKLILL